MRVYTDIDIELERVVVTLSGIVGLQDLKEIISTSVKAAVTSFPALMDARHARVVLSADDLAQIQESLREVVTRTRIAPCAVVVGDSNSLAVVGTAAQAFTGLVLVAGFLDQREAELWLGWDTESSAPVAGALHPPCGMS